MPRQNKKAVTEPAPASPTPGMPAQSVFPDDPRPIEQERRGPGRPPKICEKCFKPASECKCAAEVPPPPFDEATVQFVFKGFSQLMAVSLSLSTGLEAESLAKIWNFQPGELMLMTPPATVLANKYLPDLLKGFQDELKLLMVLLPILISKVVITKALVGAHKKLHQVPDQTGKTPSQASERVPLAEQATAA
jgi:hypothetical protein